MLHTFVVSAKEVTADNKKFIACSAKIGQDFFKIKFRRECANAPTKAGLYDLVIDEDKCSIQNGKKYTTRDGYEAVGNPTIWVGEISSIRMYTEAELAEINRAKFATVFAHENTSEG